ncbi:MAG TPA: hypothetical protein VG370_03155 [Chloroflexota bacterium]|nr:hypothetical protein [Chloroflexota bacterium]
MNDSPATALAGPARLGTGVGVAVSVGVGVAVGTAVLLGVGVGMAVLVAVPVGVGVTTITPAVARRVKESFAKRRSSYVPGLAGAANTQLPLGRGATGSGPQETYCQAM